METILDSRMGRALVITCMITIITLMGDDLIMAICVLAFYALPFLALLCMMIGFIMR
jgi:hypothetical protein